MPFTVSYTGSTTEYRVAAPTKDNKDEEFYQRMNVLAKNPEFDEEIMDLMVEECEEVFEDDDALYCFGDIDYGDGYEEFNSDGRIEVDGEEIDMGAEWVKEESNHKSEFRDLHEKLRSEVWSVEYYCQWKGSRGHKQGFADHYMYWRDRGTARCRSGTGCCAGAD